MSQPTSLGNVDLTDADQRRQYIDNLNQEAWDTLGSDVEHALALSREANALSRSGTFADSPYAFGIGYHLHTIARYELYTKGNCDQAILLAEQAHDIYCQVNNREKERRVLSLISTAYARLGAYEQALQFARDGLRIAREVGDQKMIDMALNTVAAMYLYMQDYTTALQYLEQLAERLPTDPADLMQLSDDQKITIAMISNNLCYAARMDGQLERAQKFGQDALTAFKTFRILGGQRSILSHLGMIALETHDMAAARRYFEEGLAITHHNGLDDTEWLKHMSVYYQHIGAYGQAQTMLDRALQQATAQQRKPLIRDIHLALADLFERQGDFARALHHHRCYHTVHTELLGDAQQRRIDNLRVLHNTDTARQNAEFYRQRTEQLEAQREQERLYFERLSGLKDEAINAVSHDLKSPLSVIGMNVYRLRRLLPYTPRAHVFLDRIELTIAKMTDLIANLLDLARLETGMMPRFEPIDIHDLLIEVQGSFADAAGEKGIVLELDDHTTTEQLFADPLQMRQLLENLLSNAVKYTPEGGAVVIGATCDDSTATLTVRDTGIGIPPEALPYIFERFYRVQGDAHEQVEGTGLGLALVRKIVEQHEGDIKVTSKSGQGTTFAVSLPVYAHGEAVAPITD